MIEPMRSIKQTIRTKILTVILVTGGLLFLVYVVDDYYDFCKHESIIRQQYKSRQQEMLRWEVGTAVSYINNQIKGGEPNLQARVRLRVHKAHDLLTLLYNRSWNILVDMDVRTLLEEALRTFNDLDRNDFFIVYDRAGQVVAHKSPGQPSPAGTANSPALSPSLLADPALSSEVLQMAKSKGEGFLQAPNRSASVQGKELHPVVYLKFFEPLGWTVAVGEYLEDYEAELQDKILERLCLSRFGSDGYFFGSVTGGEPLFSEGKLTRGGPSVWELEDSDGVKIIQEMNRIVRSGGGFVEYSFPRLDGEKALRKISYVLPVPRWGWIIGAGVYLDDIEKELAVSRQELFADFLQRAVLSGAIIAVLIIVAFFWADASASNIQKNLALFLAFCRRAESDAVRIEPETLTYSEFQEIAESTNRMLDQRRATLAALRMSEARYRALFENMVEGVFYQSDDSRFCEVNSAALELFGLDRETFLAMDACEPGWQVVDEDGTPLACYEFPSNRVFADGRPVVAQTAGIYNPERNDYVWVVINAIPVHDSEDGELYQVFVTLQDITPRMLAQRLLRESEKRYRIIFEKSPLGMVLLDREGKVLDCNELLVHQMNTTREKLIGIDALAGNSEEMSSAIRQALGGESSRYEGEYVSLVSGVHRVLYALFNPIDPQNPPSACIVTVEDISEQRQAEEERRRLELRLQQAQKMEAIGTLAGGIAHDFNNILSAIIGYSDMALADLQAGSRVADDVAQILTSAERARDLVKQILSFSRQAETRQVPMYPALLVREVAQLLRPTLPDGVHLELALDELAGPVLVDPTQFHQIVINLCSNGLHAMEDVGGHLLLSLREVEPEDEERSKLAEDMPGHAERFVELVVADEGEGISEEVQRRMFEPFFTTKPIGRGTGMGLATVHGLVRNSGGMIRCRSEVGQGCRFSVFLPVTGLRPEEEVRSSGEVEHGNGEKVLLVDDELPLVRMTSTMLERIGYQVTGVTDAVAALQYFMDDPGFFDVVVTDQIMPSISGLELARRLLEVSPELPIVLCTGFSSHVTREIAGMHGIREFVMKPLGWQDLAMTLRRVL